MRRYVRRTGDINIIPSTRGNEQQKQDTQKREKKKIKFDFKKKKDNTLRSLYDVEHFLSDFKHLKKYIKLYFLLK